jgi:endonuclease/exonuclease/phosphatase family metal-dependent hydrolase
LKYVRRILIAINLICLLGLLGCYAAWFLNPSDYWYISLLGLGYFLWLVLNMAFVIIWLIVKWKYSLVSLGVIVIGFSYHTKMVAFHVPIGKKESIKIMSYNVQLFKYYDWKKNDVQRDKILHFIEDNDAGIYCFQEYFQMKDQEFPTTEKLQQILPGHTMHFEAGVVKYNNQEFGLATFTKYPIVNKGHIIIDSTRNRTNLVIFTDLLIGQDTVRVYNVHLASNHLNTNEVDSMMGTSEKSFSFVKKWVKKLKNGYKRRFSQVNLLTQHLESCKYPCIIAGDFNDVPVSYTYRKINKKYKDSFIEAGSGIGATYNGNLPMLRIDYVFHSPYFGCNRFKVHSIAVTDHFPVTAELFIQKGK